MATLSLGQREKILAAYDKKNATRQQIADRFRVSLGMVKKLLQQRREIGDIAPLHHRSGRKPMIGEAHQRKMRTLLEKKPELTLRELRDALKLDCSLPAIHYALQKLGLKSKKEASQPAKKKEQKKKTAPASRGRRKGK